MAGLYIHVPFCAKRCLYCDFFSNTEMKYKEPYINALIKEMELRKGYIGNEALETIYFGGGTPSQLDEKDFGKIFEAIYRLFDVAEQAEITLEANPDDMKREYVSLLRNYPFNRVSMGVQSFHPEDLRFLNRRHDREQAIKAVELCKEYGITNISIDLIYGLPNQTKQAWEENLATSDPAGCSPSFRLPPHLRRRYRTLQINGSGKSNSRRRGVKRLVLFHINRPVDRSGLFALRDLQFRPSRILLQAQ